MSDTTRTDAQYKEYARRDNDIKCVDIEFARELERELERIRVWGNRRDEEMQHQAKLAMEARVERDQWREMAEQLAGVCKVHEPIDYRITVALVAYEKLKAKP